MRETLIYQALAQNSFKLVFCYSLSIDLSVIGSFLAVCPQCDRGLCCHIQGDLATSGKDGWCGNLWKTKVWSAKAWAEALNHHIGVTTHTFSVTENLETLLSITYHLIALGVYNISISPKVVLFLFYLEFFFQFPLSWSLMAHKENAWVDSYNHWLIPLSPLRGSKHGLWPPRFTSHICLHWFLLLH